MEKLSGDVLVGFSDFFDNAVGAAAPTKPGKFGGMVKGYPSAKVNQDIKRQGVVLKTARTAATSSLKGLAVAAKLLKKKPPKLAKPPTHVGAAPLTSKAKAALDKQKDAVKKSAAAAKRLKDQAVKTKAKLVPLVKAVRAQKETLKKLKVSSAKGPARSFASRVSKSHVGEQVQRLLDEYYTMVGAAPDPNNPGFLDDGSPDPAYWGDTGAGTGDAGGTGDLGDLSDLTAPAPEEDIQLPPPLPMSSFVADYKAVGGIVYDGSKGFPDAVMGSYGIMVWEQGPNGVFNRITDIPGSTVAAPGIDGMEHYGYVFGRYLDQEKQGGLPFGDDLTVRTWNHCHGRHALSSGWVSQATFEEVVASPSKTNPKGVPYGPIVGNPWMPDFSHMRMDGNGVYFFLPQEAPDWLTFPIRQAAALAAQAAAAAKKEEDRLRAEALAKVQADAALAQAQQDAANAIAESQAASQATVAQAATESQAQQALVEQAQADTSQQQADIAEQQAATQAYAAEQALETQQAQQYGDVLMQQAQRASQYLAAHPEEEFGPPVTGGVEEGEPPMPGQEGEQGAEGAFDDGLAVPGGDIMADQDGEGYEE